MIFDADDERRFEEDRQRARDRMAAIRGIELAAAHRATEGERDEPPPPPPKHERDPHQAHRIAIVARQVGLPPTATREQVIAAVERLSRRDIREELRRRLGR